MDLCVEVAADAGEKAAVAMNDGGRAFMLDFESEGCALAAACDIG